LWTAAAVAAAAGWAVKLTIGMRHPRPAAIAILGVYGVLYFGLTYAMKVEESGRMVHRLLRR
jgi:putative peptidoglycan lipid II flippase